MNENVKILSRKLHSPSLKNAHPNTVISDLLSALPTRQDGVENKAYDLNNTSLMTALFKWHGIDHFPRSFQKTTRLL